MFAIFLENCALSPGLRMQFGVVQSYSISMGDTGDLIDRVLGNAIFRNPGLLMEKKETDPLKAVLLSQDSLVRSQTIAIGILRCGDKVLMLRRQNPEGNLKWGFPTSVVKPNEVPEHRIVREFYAETGIRTRILKQLGIRVHPDTKAICFYYALEYVGGLLENRDDYENAEARWVDISVYQSYITSNLFHPIMEYLSEKPIEVVRCIVTHEGKLLLVHRADKDPQLSWAFPGGTVEDGETVDQTAVRELKEETNIDGEVVRIIGDRIHPYSKKHMAYVAMKPTSFDILVGDEDLDLCQWIDIADVDTVLGSSVYEKVREYLSEVSD